MSLSNFAVVIVCFLASLLGPLCGIGGGVIIKPAVDAMGVLPVATVSFLSGVSVLTMALATLAQNAASRTSGVDPRAMLPLALGSAIGGVAGKVIFNRLSSELPSTELVGASQAAVLIVLTAVVGIYTVNKAQVRSLNVTGAAPKAGIGLLAGMCWSFLGIGGGPFNLAILTFFFALETKPAAQSSLFIIAFSQGASLVYSLVLGGVPVFSAALLTGVCAAAVAGSVVGRRIARRVSGAVIDRLYLGSLALIALICAYNFVRFVS